MTEILFVEFVNLIQSRKVNGKVFDGDLNTCIRTHTLKQIKTDATDVACSIEVVT